jgi:hypothetical protein
MHGEPRIGEPLAEWLEAKHASDLIRG